MEIYSIRFRDGSTTNLYVELEKSIVDGFFLLTDKANNQKLININEIAEIYPESPYIYRYNTKCLDNFF